MFDESLVQQLDETVTALCAADLSAASTDQLRAVLRTVETTLDALGGVQARAAAAFETLGGHEADGCAKLGAWLRRELRHTAREVAAGRRAAAALEALDQVRAAADTGTIRPEHVVEFGHGIAKVGAEAMAAPEHLLLPVAHQCDPSVLRTAIDQLHHALDPDAPDREWAKAQEKQDINCRRSGHGWSVRGFLDTDTGAKLATVLKSFTAHTTDQPAAPGQTAEPAEPGQPGEPGHDAEDRPVARRRVEGLNTLLTEYLGSGLPSDKGVRPQLNVTVDYQTLLRALREDRTTPTTGPATLAGFGVIGRDLLARLACDAALTVLLTDTTTQHHHCTHHHDDAGDGHRHRCGCPITPYVHVLDVGRTDRIATPKQRLAVLVAQGYRCASPGCDNKHLEIHHIRSWIDGGRTDINNLVGLCTSCHTLLHRGLLTCRPDGHGGATFSRSDGTVIRDVRRRTMAAYAEQVGDHVAATILRAQRPRYRPGHRHRPPDPPPDDKPDGDGRTDPATTPPF